MSVAKRVSEETNTKLGELVGYAIRFEGMYIKQSKYSCSNLYFKIVPRTIQ